MIIIIFLRKESNLQLFRKATKLYFGCALCAPNCYHSSSRLTRRRRRRQEGSTSIIRILCTYKFNYFRANKNNKYIFINKQI